MTVVRDRKIRTALRTSQIVGFVTVPAWKKLMNLFMIDHRSYTLKFKPEQKKSGLNGIGTHDLSQLAW